MASAEILPRVPVAGIPPCPDDDLAMATTMPGPVAYAPEQQSTEAQALGERLRHAREAAGIEAALAGEHIVRSAATIWSYERADNAPSLFALRVLAKLYGVSLEWLQTGEGPGPGSPAPASADAVQEPAPVYPGPPPDPPGYSIRRPLAPGQPRRYRLVCPECGKPWAPEDLGRHLVTGDGCNQPHSTAEAEALIATAKRDIRPWLEELERLDVMLEDLRRRRDGTKDKTSRKVFAMSIELVEIQREKIIHCGPEKYEWHDD